MIRVGAIGYGYWGTNLVRSFSQTPGAAVRAIADCVPDRLTLAHTACPAARLTTDPKSVIDDPAIDAIVIATTGSHFEMALAGLLAGKHVLVEKPLAESSREAADLVEEAARRRVTLMVDHTFVYTGAVRRIREILAGDTIGKILFYNSERTSLHRFHPGTGVLGDLAVHDLAIVDHLIPDAPDSISATGFSLDPGGPADDARVTLLYGDQRIAHVYANWLTAVKLRRTTIGGDRGTIVYDELDASEKVKVYDEGPATVRNAASIEALRTGFRAGRMWAPALLPGEALRVMAAHFVDCVSTGARPLTDGESGLRVARWLEAAKESMSHKGRPVRLA